MYCIIIKFSNFKDFSVANMLCKGTKQCMLYHYMLFCALTKKLEKAY